MREGLPAHKISSIWVLPAGWLLAFIPLLAIIVAGMQWSGGNFCYPVDDTFIHLKISQNLAENGNWGINKGEFNSASSSLLYTLLLAAFIKIFPSAFWLPLVINIIAGIFLIYLVWNWLKTQVASPWSQALIIFLVIFFTPLPVLMLSGMEHVLQCIFSFLLLTKFGKWMDALPAGKLPWEIYIYSILLVATRYEGLFLVAGICIVLLYFKRSGQAILLGLVSLLPVILFGIISVLKGSYFLPNSVLVKSEAAQLGLGALLKAANHILIEKFMFAKAGITLLATQKLLLILPLVWIIFRNSIRRSYAAYLIIFTIAVFLQLALADTGKFYRYEASLVFLSVLICSIVIFEHLGDFLRRQKKIIRTAVLLIAIALVVPMVLRSMAAYTKAPRAMVNIYEQQYQMGLFLQQYYPREAIAANDIGAISFMRDGKVVDLWGLGTLEIARSRKSNYWNASFLDSISRNKGAGMAVIYDSWLKDKIPATWKKVATWQIPNNVVAGDDIVSYYAIDLNRIEEFKNNLSAFQKQLPSSVKVVYY